MAKKQKKALSGQDAKIVLVVLGMHRSGTSAIARGVQALGMPLGNKLLPPVAGDNEKGYWEDADINALNMEMLRHIGHDWDTLEGLTEADFQALRKAGFLRRAVTLLKEKTADHGRFAFKDPRTIRLLELWQEAFRLCEVEPRYILAIRNPLSVALSLEKNRSLDRSLGYLLWLAHMMESLTKTTGAKRAIVDYDLLMSEPENTIHRVGTLLDLRVNAPELSIFATDFLEGRLRHALFSREELALDSAFCPLVSKLYGLVVEGSKSGVDLAESMTVLKGEFELIQAVFPAVDRMRASLGEELTRRFTLIKQGDQARKDQQDRANKLEKIVEEQSTELDVRLKAIEATDQARKDQQDRADTLEKIVQEQSAELDVRLKAIEATDQARKDQQKRADTLEKIVEEQSAELDVRPKAIEATDQARMDQQERAEKQELEVTQLDHRLKTIQETIGQLGLGKKKIKTPFFDSAFYLKANPDLVLHRVDPVVHYLFHGFFEKRPAVPPKSFLSLIPRAIAERGGFAMTTVKAIKKARREGITGVKSALKKVRALAPPHSLGGYPEWVEKFDTINDDRREAIRAAMKGFTYQPLLSVVMPVYNVPPQLLEKAIASVRSQLYPHWELCIADDASTDPGIRGVLSEVSAQDDRIKVVYREQNGHISASSNSALDLAAGEFMVLLDHDDELPEHALYHVAKLLNEHPDADLIYSDEDKITEDGQRYDPYFKPDFDPLLFLAQNMISHLGVYRTALVRQIGGFRLGFEGSQDWDLALRVVEKTSRDRIHHIPRVLYHWRAVEGSTALEPTQKNYIAEPSIKAVSEHLIRCGVDAQVTASEAAPHHNRVIFKCPDHGPEVAIIIPTRDRADILKVCLDSIIQKTTYLNYKIIVVDNGSVEQETFKLFESLPVGKVSVLRENSPFNFSRLNNLAVASTGADFVCLLNNDIEILSPGWIDEMVSFANQPGVGCVGARLYYPDGRLQHGGVVIGIGGVAGHAHKYLEKGDTGYFCRAVLHQSFSAVTAACLMINRTIYNKVNGLDEQLPIAFNDIDFCLRVKNAGYRNVWTPHAEMIHHESVSRGAEDAPEKVARFNLEIEFMQRRWGSALTLDPAYNPNLTFDHEDFSLAWPPRLVA
ncbi:MAG: glycosyltransferase [Methylococcaceae bacterium]|nr:glycosyltransferase [Methylococcaceae bacterium]